MIDKSKIDALRAVLKEADRADLELLVLVMSFQISALSAVDYEILMLTSQMACDVVGEETFDKGTDALQALIEKSKARHKENITRN